MVGRGRFSIFLFEIKLHVMGKLDAFYFRGIIERSTLNELAMPCFGRDGQNDRSIGIMLLHLENNTG